MLDRPPRLYVNVCKLPDNTPISEKEERLQRLNTLINKYALENNKKYQDKSRQENKWNNKSREKEDSTWIKGFSINYKWF